LLTESLIITAIAGLAGIVVAWLLLRVLLPLLPGGQAGLAPPTIDGTVLLFTLGIALLTGVVVGVIPALRGSVANLSAQMQSGTRVSDHAGSTRLRGGFVILQVALTVMLLISTGLLVNSLIRLSTVDMGFDPDNLYTCGIQISSQDYPSEDERWQFFEQLLNRIEALPEVDSATITNKVPVLHPYQDWGVYASSRPPARPNDGISALSRWAPPGYFATMRIPLLQGRDFEPTDRGETAQVIVLSEDTARNLFPDSNPIGQLVELDFTDGRPFEVIGVVGDGRLNGVRSDPFRAMYMPYARMPSTRMQLVVRAEQDAADVAAPVRAIVRQMDRSIPIAYPTTVEEVIDDQLGGFRGTIFAMSLFAVLAMLLTAIGLFGVLSYYVRVRSREIGIRVAFGATAADIIGRVLKQGSVMVGIGVVLGLGGAVAGARLLDRLLFQTAPINAASYAGAVLFFALVAFSACLAPALRTLRIDPVEALRAE
jgi:putative ABC transport system permease protein